MAAAVRFRAAVALAGGFPALAGIDLELTPGDIVVLEGANGAGKTSLLRACAGLLRISAGEAEVLGCDLRRDPTGVRRRVGLLGHAPALYDDLTTAENVRFAVRAAGGDAAAVDGALERLGLVGRLRRTAAGRLSAGQRRRVALASLVARAPELWLLDEPHAALDRDARDLLQAIVADAARGGACVLLSSHDPESAGTGADRVVTLGGGRVLAERRGGRGPALKSVGGARTVGGGHVA